MFAIILYILYKLVVIASLLNDCCNVTDNPLGEFTAIQINTEKYRKRS